MDHSVLQRAQYGGSSEFPVWLDALCDATPEATRRGTGAHPGDVYRICAAGDVACSLRRVAGGQVRAPALGDDRWRAGRPRLGVERDDRDADGAVHGLCRAGLGAGIVYGTAIGSALKWFPD